MEDVEGLGGTDKKGEREGLEARAKTAKKAGPVVTEVVEEMLRRVGRVATEGMAV
jgi:hypothetical protein